MEISAVRGANNPSDHEFILRLVDQARMAGEAWASSWTDSILRDELTKAEVFVAVDAGGEPVGFVLFRVGGDCLEIMLIAVEPRSRGHGVVQALIGCAASVTIEAAGAQRDVHLEVRADNLAAIRAYGRGGFQQIGRRKAYYRDGTDALLYVRPMLLGSPLTIVRP